MTPDDTNDDWEGYLRRVNSDYTDEPPPEPREDVVELSGAEAVEVALFLAEYSHAVRAEYGVDPVGGWKWVEEIMHRAGIDSPPTTHE